MNDSHSSLLIVIAPPASSQPQQHQPRRSPPPPPLPPRSYAKKLPRTEQAEKTLKPPAPDPDPISRTPENPNKWRGRSVDSGSKRTPQQPGNSKASAEQRESTTKKRGSYGGGGDAPSAARRHTTPEMAASAAYGMGKSVLCGSDELEHRYRGRIEKVKFGVPISEAFAHDIPATLLVLLLKVNKEGPLKKDIWRAPGNQAQVRKLSHIMQHGRLVNISNISVYTAASVIKRFLAKLPGGILGADNERQLFDAAEQAGEEQQRELFYRIVDALPVPSQHLLVLLFGTFHVITDQQGEAFGTRMTPDAIGISVAPSLFHTCIHDGQRAKLEDIKRFKLASQVISRVIAAFGQTTLFPRECYEFYARITGRTMRVDEHWNFSFQLPSNSAMVRPVVVSRRGSRRSRRKSSNSSAVSMQSLVQAKRAAATVAVLPFSAEPQQQPENDQIAQQQQPQNAASASYGNAITLEMNNPSLSVPEETTTTTELCDNKVVMPLGLKPCISVSSGIVKPQLLDIAVGEPNATTPTDFDHNNDNEVPEKRRSGLFLLQSPSFIATNKTTAAAQPRRQSQQQGGFARVLSSSSSATHLVNMASAASSTTTEWRPYNVKQKLQQFQSTGLDNNAAAARRSNANRPLHFRGPPPPPHPNLKGRIDRWEAEAAKSKTGVAVPATSSSLE